MKIKNENYEVTFVEKGGEIFSFTNLKNGIQYMYQGDSKYWSGKNPTLFPMVGSTFTGSYEIDGKTYSMKNHGIIRYATLKCTNKSEKSITFTLESDEETLKVYPFKFKYEVTYTLNENTLDIVYHITNKDKDVMPFAFGLHPGFKVPLHENETFEDYKVEFEKDEHMKQIIFDKNKKEKPYIKDIKMKTWNLNYDDIEKHETLVYTDLNSKYVTLSGKEGNGVKVTCDGYPFFAIWTAERNAPFICLEPWYSHDDYEVVNVEFKNREGMKQLNSGETFVTSYSITVF